MERSGAVLKGACHSNTCSFLSLCPPALCCVRTCVSPEDLTAKVLVGSTSNFAWFQSLDLAFHNSLSCYKCILVPYELLRWWYFFSSSTNESKTWKDTKWSISRRQQLRSHFRRYYPTKFQYHSNIYSILNSSPISINLYFLPELFSLKVLHKIHIVLCGGGIPIVYVYQATRLSHNI